MEEAECGECRACCVELWIQPTTEGGFPDGKEAGTPCVHLDAAGCSLHGKPAMPALCKNYRCLWHAHEWFRGKSAYRPDRLGVVFQANRAARQLTLFEVRPGVFAADAGQLRYIASRVWPGSRLLWHHYGVFHGTGTGDRMRDDVERVALPNGDEAVRFKAGAAPRLALPVLP